MSPIPLIPTLVTNAVASTTLQEAHLCPPKDVLELWLQTTWFDRVMLRLRAGLRRGESGHGYRERSPWEGGNVEKRCIFTSRMQPQSIVGVYRAHQREKECQLPIYTEAQGWEKQ